MDSRNSRIRRTSLSIESGPSSRQAASSPKTVSIVEAPVVVASAAAAFPTGDWEEDVDLTTEISDARPATIPGTAEIGRLAGLGSDFYVGVSGYGVYKIAFDDITGVEWTKLHGTLANVYNVYPFTVNGKNRLAVALDEEIAILDLDASPVVPSQSNITSPDNDPFTVGHNSSDCNDYYGAEENPFKPTDITSIDDFLYVSNGRGVGGDFVMRLKYDSVSDEFSWDNVAFGGTGSGTKYFKDPTGLFSKGAKLYVADTSNERVQVYTQDPTTHAVTGPTTISIPSGHQIADAAEIDSDTLLLPTYSDFAINPTDGADILYHKISTNTTTSGEVTGVASKSNLWPLTYNGNSYILRVGAEASQILGLAPSL